MPGYHGVRLGEQFGLSRRPRSIMRRFFSLAEIKGFGTRVRLSSIPESRPHSYKVVLGASICWRIGGRIPLGILSARLDPVRVEIRVLRSSRHGAGCKKTESW
jgi:hypothetical protein